MHSSESHPMPTSAAWGLLALCFVLTLPPLPPPPPAREQLSMALPSTRPTGQMDQSNERCNNQKEG